MPIHELCSSTSRRIYDCEVSNIGKLRCFVNFVSIDQYPEYLKIVQSVLHYRQYLDSEWPRNQSFTWRSTMVRYYSISIDPYLRLFYFIFSRLLNRLKESRLYLRLKRKQQRWYSRRVNVRLSRLYCFFHNNNFMWKIIRSIAKIEGCTC